MNSNPIRILLADDQEIAREGYKQILAEQPELQIIAMATDGQEAVALAQKECPDVAMLDIRMPHLNGLEAAQQIRAICPEVGILMLSFYDDPRYVRAFFKQGAAGKAFLLKQSIGEITELVRAIHAVANGQIMVDQEIVNELINNAPLSMLQELTPQELRVLELMTKGHTNAGIAQALTVQERTIENYVSNIFAKLDLRDSTQQSRVQAVLLFLEATGRLRPADP
jgi:DNA-binding NarL/FixJ family response regulator